MRIEERNNLIGTSNRSSSKEIRRISLKNCESSCPCSRRTSKNTYKTMRTKMKRMT